MDYLIDLNQLMLNGEFNEALKQIEKIVLEVELTNTEKNELNLLKCKAYLGIGQHPLGLQLSNDMLKNARNEKEFIFELEFLVVNISLLDSIGNFNEILNKVYSGEKLINKMDQGNERVQKNKGNLIFYKGKILLEKGNDSDALKLFKEAHRLFRNLGQEREIAKCLILISNVFSNKGENEIALKYLKNALEIQERISDMTGIAKNYRETGNVYLFQGQREKALDLYQKSYQIYLRIGNTDFIGRVLNNIGIIHHLNGDLKQGEQYYEKSIESLKINGNKVIIARIFNNIGNLNIKMGNLDKAEINIKESLATFQEIGKVQNIMNSFNQLGRIYHLRGLFDDALLNFQLSLNMMDQISSKSFNSFTLYYYIVTALQKNDLEDAKEKLELLKKIDLECDEPPVHIRTTLATALLLKTSDRAKNRVKAEEYFEEIILSEIADFDMKITSMFNLCELHILELKETSNKELLEEVKILANQILEIAEKNDSMLILTEAYWLLSQIALIELNIRSAREFLTKAQNIAQEWGIHQLAQKISRNHDILLGRLEIWEKLSHSNAEIPEIIETAEIEEFFKKLYLDKELDIQFQPEEPVMFLLIKPSGLPIYSKNFIQTKELDDSLIGGFLSAIRFFSKEAFSQKGPIDRIKHNDYTIIINSFEMYLACYVFKGQSFSALQKLTQIIGAIKYDEKIWKELANLDSSTQHLSETGLEFLDGIVSRMMISSI